MRHLSLTIELETPICYHDAIIQASQEMCRKVGDNKFNSYVYVTATIHSTVETNALSIAKLIHGLAESFVHSEHQILKLKTDVKKSSVDMLYIDVFELELNYADNSRD